MLKCDDQAASEIVGALMLVMIVVAASASFATFALDRQEDIQEQQRFKMHKEGEEFTFGRLELVDDEDDGQWDQITVLVHPLHTREFSILGTKLDGMPLREFTVTRPQQDAPNAHRIVGHPATLPYALADPYVDPATTDFGPDRLMLAPREDFQITINLRDSGSNPQGNGAQEPYDPSDDTEDFYGSTPAVTDVQAFRIAFTTAFLNEFEQAYIPPSISLLPRLDCAYDLLTFEVRDIHVHQDEDYALRLDWTATTSGAGGNPDAASGYQYIVNLAGHANGDTITATVEVELASGLRSTKAVPVTLPVGCL